MCTSFYGYADMPHKWMRNAYQRARAKSSNKELKNKICACIQRCVSFYRLILCEMVHNSHITVTSQSPLSHLSVTSTVTSHSPLTKTIKFDEDQALSKGSLMWNTIFLSRRRATRKSLVFTRGEWEVTVEVTVRWLWGDCEVTVQHMLCNNGVGPVAVLLQERAFCAGFRSAFV